MNIQERIKACFEYRLGEGREVERVCPADLEDRIAALVREAVNDALERAAQVADLGCVPSRDWHAQQNRDPEDVEAAVSLDIAAGIRGLKEPAPVTAAQEREAVAAYLEAAADSYSEAYEHTARAINSLRGLILNGEHHLFMQRRRAAAAEARAMQHLIVRD